MTSPTEIEVTPEMLEAGADAYHEACEIAKRQRKARNDAHEAAGRGRPAHENGTFPIDWLEPVFRAMLEVSGGMTPRSVPDPRSISQSLSREANAIMDQAEGNGG